MPCSPCESHHTETHPPAKAAAQWICTTLGRDEICSLLVRKPNREREHPAAAYRLCRGSCRSVHRIRKSYAPVPPGVPTSSRPFSPPSHVSPRLAVHGPYHVACSGADRGGQLRSFTERSTNAQHLPFPMRRGGMLPGHRLSQADEVEIGRDPGRSRVSVDGQQTHASGLEPLRTDFLPHTQPLRPVCAAGRRVPPVAPLQLELHLGGTRWQPCPEPPPFLVPNHPTGPRHLDQPRTPSFRPTVPTPSSQDIT